ncbi:hypothetical protein [Bradyrhizobium sp. AS23.2]|uniref:hypothetical protein n=1 Tax=Bradyrhizobium sp. AS23.2 TaxID=1680155 RepID=UPI000939021F|nr:hypothetical protein [Bradyrhizobium sp. AS23.2]OKO86183.1 hypothetical protein AC630_03890 [Bradyrhizobium sp. AS23.2]
MRIELNGKTYVDQEGCSTILNNTPKCLAAWRARNYGPAYHRIGGRVLYELGDIVAFINGTKIEAA